MSLFIDMAQGAGLAGATGVRPFLPPLLAGALATNDVGLDFDGTAYSFLESPNFLFLVLALAVLAYVLERRRGERPASAVRDPVTLGFGVVAVVLGGLLFAGSLADGGFAPLPGLVAGLAFAALGYVASTVLFGRVRRRLQGGPAALLPAYADAIALVLAVLAVFVPPLSLLALVVFAVFIVRARRAQAKKYEGLRILR